ncbi:MAG: exodeoxyribonuclease III [Deltaproteobacteria bacterium]|nr:exodeoxyribonuclease III [Deltaproteobacteria bacterium]
MRLVSWNINSIRMRLPRLLALLKRVNPDIICLQELKCTEDKFPFDDIAKVGYQVSALCQKAYNGVAILAKNPPSEVSRLLDIDKKTGVCRFLQAKIEGVNIISVYVPNGQLVGSEQYIYKLAWLKQLREYLEIRHKPSDALIIAGDFNVAPEDRDVYDPEQWRGKVLFSDPEKKALKELCDFGLSDTFRIHHQEGGHYSWWDYRQLGFPKNHGLRLDFILASKTLADRCTSASILREERKGEKPSDHAPIIAEFKVGALISK